MNPNVVFIFGDQWRGQATGYSGNTDVKTPNLDVLAEESIDFVNAVSGCPACGPARASLLTGQYPLTHGVFLNHAPLDNKATFLGSAFRDHNYDTAYIGKWHVDGHGFDTFIPPERHKGFNYWKASECTHDYYHSIYYSGDSDIPQYWDGYDAFAQTRDAVTYIEENNQQQPFLLLLSWGPPHPPYETAPAEFRELYDESSLRLRPNVSAQSSSVVSNQLAGYYAHCSALDYCVGLITDCLRDTGLGDNTILVFTSDHGDMIGSHDMFKKQHPWDESIRVPLLIRYPEVLGREGRVDLSPISSPDIMPTLLGLCDLELPDSVEGHDYSANIRDMPDGMEDDAALIACYHPFGEWAPCYGGREYRGLRDERHTYVRSLQGPWLLYDNLMDPYQLKNLIGNPEYASLQQALDDRLERMLKDQADEFLPGSAYLQHWKYEVDVTTGIFQKRR